MSVAMLLIEVSLFSYSSNWPVYRVTKKAQFLCTKIGELAFLTLESP